MDLQIRIINYDKYKGRSDVKEHSWFRLSNRFLEDHEFFDFTFGEKLVWIYLLSLASQKNTDAVHVSYQHAHHVANLDKNVLTSAIEKLTKIKCIEKIRTRTLRGRYAADTHPCATEQNRTEQTEQNSTQQHSDELGEFVMFWNSQNFGLPKVKNLSKDRRSKLTLRLREASIDEWKSTIKKIGESSFLVGKNNSGWKADFDWLIGNETNRLKIIEGKYESTGATNSKYSRATIEDLEQMA